MTDAEIFPKDLLRRLIRGENLAIGEAESLFEALMAGAVGEVTTSAILTALAAKGESIEEIAGAAAVMRRHLVTISTRRTDVVDTCGTGGDGKGTFNISTAAAIVAAAAGVPIAKHGNRSVSSRSGSADVLEALGVEIEIVPERAGQALDELGIAFLFAPQLHPTMARVMPVRQELGVRTIFNILGPLVNPAGARRQVLGVYDDRLVPVLAEVLLRLGCDHAMVVRGADGLDELTTTSTSLVAEVRLGRIEHYQIFPENLGIPVARPEELLGGEPQDNAAFLRQVLAGEPGPLADITALNAGAAVYVGGRAEDLEGGIDLARTAIESGAASRKLDEMQEFQGSVRP